MPGNFSRSFFSEGSLPSGHSRKFGNSRIGLSRMAEQCGVTMRWHIKFIACDGMDSGVEKAKFQFTALSSMWYTSIVCH